MATTTVAKKARPKRAANKTATPAKKAPARKVAVVKAKTSPKSSPAAAAAAVQKAPAKKATAPKVEKTVGRPRVMDDYGFVVDSDSSIIASVLIEGGKDRNDINDKAAKRIDKINGLGTRGGGTKNIPSLVSGILSRMEEVGYKVESSWVLKSTTKTPRKVKAKNTPAAAEGKTAGAPRATKTVPAKARPVKKVAAKRAAKKASAKK